MLPQVALLVSQNHPEFSKKPELANTGVFYESIKLSQRDVVMLTRKQNSCERGLLNVTFETANNNCRAQCCSQLENIRD